MELDSQKKEFLEILHKQGVPLGVEDFKPAQGLRWVKEKLPISGGPSHPSGWPKRYLAIEDPTTGYFFASSIRTNPEVWSLVYTPAPGSPLVKVVSCALDKYREAFNSWVSRLRTEIEADKPWLDRLPLGRSPLTFGKTAILERRLRDCGLDTNWLEVKGNHTRLELKIPDSKFGFDLKPDPNGRGWNGELRPGAHKVRDPFSSLSWNDVLKQVDQWCNYLKREQSVVFPSPPTPQTDVKRASIKLTQLVLKNIRRFPNLELPFQPTTTVLCGPNGTGKSTILRCLAIALCHEADTAALLADVPGGLLNHNSDNGSIELRLQDSEGDVGVNRVEIQRKDGRDYLQQQSKESKDVFFCGYGSVFGLQAEQTRSEFSSRESSRSLFDYGTKLFSLEMVLRRLNDRFGESSRGLISQLTSVLGLSGVPLVKKGGGVEFAENGASIAYEGLADGYRVSLAWMLDLYGWALVAEALKSDTPTGILLCDEVDKHMHPALQAELIGNLEKALPEMQMVLTTHNPLTVLGCRPESVFVLDFEDDKVSCHPAPNFHGASVEDIYTHEDLFDVEPYSPEIQKLLDQHAELAKIPKESRTEQQRSRLISVANELMDLRFQPDP